MPVSLLLALLAAATPPPGMDADEEAPETEAEAPGPPPSVPWALTGTSSIAEVPAPSVGARVERRYLEKSDRLALRGGFTYLSRDDFRTNPGIAVEGSWYVLGESLAIDLVSASIYLSTLSSTAEALRKRTGLLPDSQKPIARITTGGRYAFAYGKVLLESLDAVVHLDASLALHGGVMITDAAPNIAGDVSLGVQAAIRQRFLFWIEGGWLVSYEDRTDASFAGGPFVTLGLGALLL